MHPHRPSTTRLVWIACLGGLAGFAAIAMAVAIGEAEAVDRPLLLAFRVVGDIADPLGPPWFEEMAAELTTLGGYPVLVIAGTIAFVTLWLSRQHAAALFLAASLAGGSTLSQLLKLVFARARPDLVEPLDRTFTASFPSGHATVGMLAWLVLAAVAARFVPRHAVRAFLVCSALVLGVVIGLSRVYLGVHWPSDVAAGWCLGIAWAAGCWLAAHYLAIGRDHPSDGRRRRPAGPGSPSGRPGRR
ncbi:MAG: phosphatase PAP2 family protein [Azospirillaceae bacterium]